MANPKIPVLLELRKELENELNELKARIRRIEEYIGALDVSITTSSFATADSAITGTSSTTPIQAPVTDTIPELRSIVLFNKGRDLELATLEVTSQEITGIPAPHAIYDIKRGAFARFFVERILGKFQEEDRHKVEAGSMTWENAFDFEVRADDGILEEINIKNYGGEVRLAEIERALRWALEKIYRAR
ncbi:MAG: hypothetical protein P1Q69_04295 [Candidatus Thorarchaeota archaeon]|nr:hypothetical protein [Candidatus Thorarchaeota archaeon]